MDMVALHDKYEKLRPHLNERTRRLLAAADAEFLGRGGVALVARAANLSRPTLYKAMAELKDGKPNPERVRREGGGRKTLAEKHPDLDAALERLVSSTSRGDPMNPLRWTIKSTRQLARELARQGYRLSHPVVAGRLAALHYSLPANAKAVGGGQRSCRPQCAIRAHQCFGGAMSGTGATGDLGGCQEEGIGGAV